MLQFLHIKNLALLKEVCLEFQAGFTAATGETGAGKSVLLGALNLLAGNRTDRSIIRANTDTCEIEGVFNLQDSTAMNEALASLGLPQCDEEGTLILKRIIDRKKPQRVYVNDSPTTLNSLQLLGKLWIDFHGPGEPQKLLHKHYQIDMLDAFSGTDKSAFDTHYTQWQSILKQIHTLENSEQLGEDERTFYQSQINTIQALNPTEASIEALERDYKRISCAQELSDCCHTLSTGLTGKSGVNGLLTPLLKEAQKIQTMDPNLGTELQSRLESVMFECEDLAAEYSYMHRELDFNPLQVHEIQEKMNQWLEIQRKYGPSLEQVLQKKAKFIEKIENQSNIAERISELEAEASKVQATLLQEAEKITLERIEAAKQLSGEILIRLKQLGFKHAEFKISVTPTEAIEKSGNSTVEFQFAPNPGQKLFPLSKIASSGEMARVMLALKTVLATVDATPVLVFDEVDANVGGEIGVNVAKELVRLGEKHQVICITHLPQVASQADNHILVSKQQYEANTEVSIQAIDETGDVRIQEIARMLGDRNAPTALRHATELLESRKLLVHTRS